MQHNACPHLCKLLLDLWSRHRRQCSYDSKQHKNTTLISGRTIPQYHTHIQYKYTIIVQYQVLRSTIRKIVNGRERHQNSQTVVHARRTPSINVPGTVLCFFWKMSNAAKTSRETNQNLQLAPTKPNCSRNICIIERRRSPCR